MTDTHMDTVFAEETFDWVRRGIIVIKNCANFADEIFEGFMIDIPQLYQTLDRWL